MGKTRVILLDADNTLFDFDLSQRQALLETIGLGEKSPEGDEAFAVFKEINDQAWREHEEGLLDREVLRVERFRRLADARALPRSPEESAVFYLDTLSAKGELFPGVMETLGELRSKGMRLGLATNGFSQVQRGRIAASGIGPLFDGIFISEEMELKKPDPAFFRACLESLGADPSESLMVGDSPSADIAGGKSAGIPCAWINSHRLPYPPELPSPDLELSSVNELPRSLGIGL